MKKRIIFSLSLLLSFSVAAQYPYVVYITGLPDALNGKKIALTVQDDFSNNRYSKSDTAVIRNQRVQFAGNMPWMNAEATLQITIAGNLYQNSFVLDTGQNDVIVKPVNKRSFAYNNPVSNIVLPASPANRLHFALDSIRYAGYLAAQKWAVRHIEHKKVRIAELNTIATYPDCFYALIRLYQLRKVVSTYLHYDSMIHAFNRLAPAVRNTPLGQELLAKLQAEQSIKVGNPAPAFAVPDTKGVIVTSSQFSGKVYLLAFGAPWCGPCIKGYDYLKKLYSQYKKAGLEIVYVNVDSSRSKWLAHIIKYQLPWINVSELKGWFFSPIAKQYAVKFIPTYYIIDRQGKILYNPYELNDRDEKMLEQFLTAALKLEP